MKKKVIFLLGFFLFALIAFRLWNNSGSKEKIPVVIDADPGIDDAFALMAAATSDQLEILGITTVHGNVSLAKTSLNALKLACYLGIDCPVAIGAEYALDGSTSDAIYVHGANGLGNVSLPAPTRDFDKRSAVELLHDAAVAAEGKLQILAIGPLTNIAQWMTEYPEDLALIDAITLMGGSQSEGNASTYGEFNSYADPAAADIVYSSGVAITMVDYSITQYNYVPTDLLLESVFPDNLLYPFITALCDFLDQDSAESGGITLHDLHAALLLIHPGSSFTRQATVTVPLDLPADHRGQTIVTFNEEGNVRVLRNKKNAARIQSYVTDVISAFDGLSVPQADSSDSLSRETGWSRLVLSDPLGISSEEGTFQLESFFLLEDTGSIGAILSSSGYGEDPPSFSLQAGGRELPFSLSLSATDDRQETVWWIYFSELSLPDDIDPTQDAIVPIINQVALSPLNLERRNDIFSAENGQAFLPLDEMCHFLCAVTPQQNRQVAAPVLTGENRKAQITYAASIPFSADEYSLTLICAPFAAEDLLITGLEYEGLSERITSSTIPDWNPSLLPASLSIQDVSLEITAVRTKTDSAGLPCIRIAYSPFTNHGRVWRASAVRLIADRRLSAAQQNGFLYFPLLETEPYATDQTLTVIVTLDFLFFDPTILSFV